MYTAKRKGFLAFFALALITALVASAVYLSAPAVSAYADTKNASSATELMQAMVGAAEGDTVQLTDDVTLDLTQSNAITGTSPNGHMVFGTKTELGSDKGINNQTLDLNGHTLTITTGSTVCCIEVRAGVAITVRNGTLAGSSAGVFASGAAGSSIVLESATLNYTYTGTADSGVAIDSAGEVALRAVTFALTNAEEFGAETRVASVAKIGDTYYGTLQSALEAVAKNSTNVDLVADTEENIDLTLAYTGINLRLNGNTLSGNLTFRTEMNKSFYVDKEVENVGKIVGSITVIGANTKYLQFFMRADADVSSFSVSGYGKAYLYNGTYNDLTASDTSTELCINGGTIDGTVTVSDSAKLTIKGGTFNSETPVVNNGGTVTLSGDSSFAYAKFKNTSSVGQYLSQGYLLSETPDEDGYYSVVFNQIFEINGTYYNSLASAVSAAQEGDTILLLKDYTLTFQALTFDSKSITIDLNGNRLIETYGGRNSFQIGNSSKVVTVTFTDGSAEKTGAIVYEGDASAAATAFVVTRDCTLVLDGVTVDYTKSQRGYGVVIGAYNDGTQISLYGIVELKGATVKAGVVGVALYGCKAAETPSVLTATDSVIEGGWYGVAGNGSYPNTKITLNHCTVSATDENDSTGIFHPQIGEIIVNGGSVTGQTGIEMRSGSLTVTGGASITGTGNPATANPNGSGTTVIGAAIAISQHKTNNEISVSLGEGTYTGVYAVYEEDLQDDEGTDGISIGIAGGTFCGKVSSENVTGFISGGTFTEAVENKYFEQGLAPVKDSDGNYVVTNAAAEINGVGYATLQEAVNAAQNGETVILLADVSENVVVAKGQEIVLDLHGNTLTNAGGHTITNNGTLTINDSADGGAVTNATDNKATVYNAGVATLNAGLYTRTDDAGNTYYVVDNHGEMTIAGGEFVSPDASSSMIRNAGTSVGGTLTIEDGTFRGGLNTVKNDDYGVLYITGGTLENTTQHVIMNWATAEISGGVFTPSDGASAAVWSGTWYETAEFVQGQTTITGGTFNGTVTQGVGLGAPNQTSDDVSYTIKTAEDGTSPVFAVAPDYSYFAEDFYLTATENEDGKRVYTVIESTQETVIAARIGAIGYTSLQEAIADAEENAVIVLLAKATGTITVENGKTVTIDLRGYSLGDPADTSTSLVNKGTLTLKDSVGGGTVSSAGIGFAIENKGDLTLEKVTVTARMPIANTDQNAVATVKGATINGTMAAIIATTGKVVIEEGTVSGFLQAGERATLTITGGSFDTLPDEKYLAEGILFYADENGKYVADTAANAVAKIGGVGYATLQAAIDAAGDGNTVILLTAVTEDIVISAEKTFTLDLNGETLTGMVKVDNADANVTIQNGTVTSDGVWDSSAREATLYVRSGSVTLNAVTVAATAASEATAAIAVYGTLNITSAAVTSNGYGIGVFDEAQVDITTAEVETKGNPISTNVSGSEAMTLTIKGGTYTCAANQNNWAYVAIYWASHGTLNISGGEFTSTAAEAAGLYVKNGAVNISGGKFYGTKDGVKVTLEESNSTAIEVNIDGGTFTGTRSGLYLKTGANGGASGNYKVDVTDGTFGGTNSVYTSTTFLPEFTVAGGTFETALETGLTEFISGGAFKVCPAESSLAENFLVYLEENGNYTVADEETAIAGGVAAKVGAQGFAKLQEAILAASEEATVTLLTDVSEDITVAADRVITLDLNGHKITNVAGHTVTNQGNLTVTDSVGGGTVDNVTHGKGAIYNAVGATVNLYGGNFTRSKEAGKYGIGNNGNSWYVLFNQGTMVIGEDENSAVSVFTGTSAEDSLNYNYSSLIENGWTDPSKKPSDAPNASLTVRGGLLSTGLACVKNDECATLTVTGGVFHCPEDQAIMAWSDVEITGGEFNGAVIAWTYDGIVSDYAVAIQGGTFHYEIETRVDGNGEATLPEVAISGGLFKVVPDYTFFAEGSIATEAATEGYYGVTDGSYVAYIENAEGVKVGYSSLQSAIDAAEENAVVVLIADVEIKSTVNGYNAGVVIEGKNIVLDGNGHKIYTDSIQRLFWVLGGASQESSVAVQLRNLTIDNEYAPSSARALETRGGYFTLTLDNVNVFTGTATGNNQHSQAITVGGNHADGQTNTIHILNSRVLSGGSGAETGNNEYGIVIFNPVVLNVQNSTVAGWTAIYCKPADSSQGSAGSVINIGEGSRLIGESIYNGGSDVFAVLVFEDDSIEINIADATVESIQSGVAVQFVAMFSAWNDPKDVVLNIAEGAEIIVGSENASHFIAINDQKNTVAIRGGSFNIDVDDRFIAEGCLVVKNSSGTYSVAAEQTLVDDGSIVAKIGAHGYATLQEAIAACADGENTEIVLLADAENILIPEGKVITLDVNGFTVTATKAGTAAIRNFGTLYLLDNAETKGTITRTSDTTWYVIVNNGTMEISDVTVKNENAADPSSLVINNYVPYENRAELTVHSGEFYSFGSNAVKNDELGKLIINGGTFSSNPTQHAAVMTWGTADIYGGTFVSDNDSGIAIMAYGKQTNTTTIYGGTFNAPTALYIQSGDSGNDPGVLNIAIQGGTFNGDLVACDAEGFIPSSTDTFTVTAGKFVGTLTLGEMTAKISGGTFVNEEGTVASDMLDQEYVAYYTDDATEITVAAKTAVPAGAILIAGRSAQNFDGYQVDGAFIAVQEKNEYIIIGAEGYAERVIADLEAFKADLYRNNLYSENGKAQIESYYAAAIADINGFAEAGDAASIGRAAQSAKTAMSGVPTKYVDEAALAEAIAQAKTELKQYAAALGVLWSDEYYGDVESAATLAAVTEAKLAAMEALDGKALELNEAKALAEAIAKAKTELKQYAAALGVLWSDEYYGDVESAATLAAVSEAKLAAMEALDGKIAALNEAKTAAIAEVEAYAAAQKDEEGKVTAEAVTVPTATYAAINGAASTAEIDAYVANAKAEIDALRAAAAQTASLNEQLSNLDQAVAALQAVADANGEKLDSLASALETLTTAVAEAKAAIATANNKLDTVEGAVDAVAAAQTKMAAALNEFVAATNATLATMNNALDKLDGDLATLTGALATVNSGLTAKIDGVQSDVDAISAALVQMSNGIDADYAALTEKLTALQATINAIGESVNASTTVEEAKTSARTQLDEWLTAYLNALLDRNTAATGNAKVAAYMLTANAMTSADYNKLQKAFGESGAKLVEKYYNDAMTAIDGATTATEVAVAVSNFKTQVAMVELIDGLNTETDLTGVYVMLAVIAVIAVAAVVLAIVLLLKKNGGQPQPVAAAQPREEGTATDLPVAQVVSAEKAEEPETEETPDGEEPEEETSENAEEPAETADEEVPAEEQPAEEEAAAKQEETVAADADKEPYDSFRESEAEGSEEAMTVSEAVADVVVDESDASAPDWRTMGTKYYKPFTERMAEASDENKAWYSEIKNEFCSYQKVKGRFSRKCESFRAGRNLLAKVMIIGKTLRVYLALNPADYEFSMYHHRDMSDKKSFAEVPMMIKVKSPRGVKKAKRLIGEMMQKLQIGKKSDYVEQDYTAAFVPEET